MSVLDGLTIAQLTHIVELHYSRKISIDKGRIKYKAKNKEKTKEYNLQYYDKKKKDRESLIAELNKLKLSITTE